MRDTNLVNALREHADWWENGDLMDPPGGLDAGGGGMTHLGDITKIHGGEAPVVDVVIGHAYNDDSAIALLTVRKYQTTGASRVEVIIEEAE